MARKPANEEMVIKSIYGPKRLLDRPGLSEYVVGLLEQDYVGQKPEDPRLSTIQSKLSEYVQIDPDLPHKYFSNELATERVIMMKLRLDGIDNATDSDISAFMVAVQGGKL